MAFGRRRGPALPLARSQSPLVHPLLLFFPPARPRPQSLLTELRLHAREPLDAATLAQALGGAAGGGDLDLNAPLWPAWFARIAAFMHECEGAYSFVALTKDAVYAVRDDGNFLISWAQVSLPAGTPSSSGNAIKYELQIDGGTVYSGAGRSVIISAGDAGEW